MNNLIDDSNERSSSLWRGKDKAEERRLRNPKSRGRPIKNSGIYFTEHVLLDPETYDFIMKKKIGRHEPIGAVIRRMALMQKKAEALKAEIIEDTPEMWNNIWNNVTNKDILVYHQSVFKHE